MLQNRPLATAGGGGFYTVCMFCFWRPLIAEGALGKGQFQEEKLQNRDLATA